jgi:hypothetical protein
LHSGAYQNSGMSVPIHRNRQSGAGVLPDQLHFGPSSELTTDTSMIR